jgi:hypothetical protein
MDYIRIPWHSIMFHYTFHYTARHYIHIYNYWHKWITSIYKRLKPLWCLYANQLGDFRSQISPFLASIAAETSGAMFLLWTWELWSGWWKSRAHRGAADFTDLWDPLLGENIFLDPPLEMKWSFTMCKWLLNMMLLWKMLHFLFHEFHNSWNWMKETLKWEL